MDEDFEILVKHGVGSLEVEIDEETYENDE